MKNIKISNIELDTVDGSRCVKFTASKNNITHTFLEWVNVHENDEGEFLNCEKIDSHVRTNELDKVQEFGVEVSEILAAVDAEIFELA